MIDLFISLPHIQQFLKDPILAFLIDQFFSLRVIFAGNIMDGMPFFKISRRSLIRCSNQAQVIPGRARTLKVKPVGGVSKTKL